MKKVSIIIPHFKTWRWTAICVHAFKKYGTLIDREIIVCNNSPGHPSIKCLTDTEIGEGVKIVDGMHDFPSHGMGYDIAYKHSDGDWIFTSETDSFPTRHGWFESYIVASVDCDLVGPEVPQSSGKYIHPAGAMVRRSVVESAIEWQKANTKWVFVPGGAVELGLASWPYHVVTTEERIRNFLHLPSVQSSELWRRCGPWQEMRSFDTDTLDTYTKRTGESFRLLPSTADHYIKIGYEAGQWLSYFASQKFRVMKAPGSIQWMPGLEMKQAAQSTVFDGFQHVWCGTVSTLPNDISPQVKQYKLSVMNKMFAALPDGVRAKIEKMEAEHVA